MTRAGLLFLALLPAALGAQDTTRTTPARDTTARDTTARGTTARDTTVRDSTARDTIPALLPVFGPAIAPGPLPRGTRYVFTADSILLSGARTLSDLLTHIPGVYVARGGWYGEPEIVLYGGRGAASLEIYWDGAPMLPLGRDSIYVDPARVPLGPVERVDVIVLPAQIRVYLATAQYRSTAPRTQVGILTGQADIADYRAGYSTRTRSGFGVSMVADWASIGNGPLGITSPPFGTSDIWVKADYVPPGGRMGASFQISSSSWHRASAPGVPPKILGVDGWRQDRRDRLLQVFVAQRDDGLGWRATVTLASSGISHDTLVANRTISSANLELSQTWRRATVSAVGRLGGAGFPQQIEGRLSWIPIAPLTLSGSIRQSAYRFDRKGVQAYGMAGLTLPLGFSARAEIAWRKDPQAALLAVPIVTQQQVDVAGWVRFDHRRLMVEVGRGRRDPFEPFGFASGIKSVRSLSPTPLTEFIAAHASLQVVPGVQVSAWYFDPVVGGGDFEPPHHARISAAFYSKFWRVFKSGIFALRGEVAMESWGRSLLGGRDSTGAALGITGSSFVDTNLELQLAGVTIFWSIENVNIMRSSYVTGLGYPKAAQQYGARWFFIN